MVFKNPMVIGTSRDPKDRVVPDHFQVAGISLAYFHGGDPITTYPSPGIMLQVWGPVIGGMDSATVPGTEWFTVERFLDEPVFDFIFPGDFCYL